MPQRFIAPVPPANRIDDVCWLVLQHDETDTGGWFLFQHESLTGPAKFDTWHETRDQAEQQAAWEHGVSAGDWRSADEPSGGPRASV